MTNKKETIGMHTDISLIASANKITNMAEDNPNSLWKPDIIKHQRKRRK